MAEDKEIIFILVASFEGCSKSGGKFCFFYLNAKDGLSGVSINLYKMKRILFQLFIMILWSYGLTVLRSYDLTVFPSGIYFVKITTETNIITQKLIKL